jgi:hypothetical protein
MADFSRAHPSSGSGPGPIPPRIRLVIALTETHSRHLSAQTRVAAAEIELERSMEDGRLGLNDPAREAQRKQLQQQFDKARDELRVLDAERDWIEQELANFDTEPQQASPGDRQ